MEKIAGIEFTKEGLTTLTNNHLLKNESYIVRRNAIYQLRWSNNIGLVANKIHSDKKLTRTGRYFVYTAQQVNHLLGFKLVSEAV
jgi:hypothetical protein